MLHRGQPHLSLSQQLNSLERVTKFKIVQGGTITLTGHLKQQLIPERRVLSNTGGAWCKLGPSFARGCSPTSWAKMAGKAPKTSQLHTFKQHSEAELLARAGDPTLPRNPSPCAHPPNPAGRQPPPPRIPRTLISGPRSSTEAGRGWAPGTLQAVVST